MKDHKEKANGNVDYNNMIIIWINWSKIFL